MFSGVRARKVRVAATEAGLQLVTSLVHIAKVKADTRDLKQRQLDAEGKKKRPNKAMMKTLKEALTHAQTRIRTVETMIKDSFTKIFTHRFRDIDPLIRATCMRSIGGWMRDHPLFFLSDFYLKYLGWSLNDKDARVRLAVLTALRELYAASSENLALMDTFNARFIGRVREMVDDVDSGVAAEAVGTLAVLHETGVLPREDMEPVVSLLLDGDEKVRNAAAAVIPSLITPPDAEDEEGDGDGGEGGNGGVGGGAAVGKSGEEKSRETLMSIVHIIKGLQGSRARTASTVDALWYVYHADMSDWNLVCNMLLSDDQDSGVGGKGGKGGKIKNKNSATTKQRQAAAPPPPPLESEDAAGLANVLACAVRRAQGEHLMRVDSSGGHGTGGHVHARESFTQTAMKLLPLILRRWRSEEDVVGPLIETIRHLKLEHYALKHKEGDFQSLMKCVVDVFLQHSSRRVLDACSGAMHCAATEGYESQSLKEIGKRCGDDAFAEVCKKLHVAVDAARAEKHRGGGGGGGGGEEINDDEGHHFQIRTGLTRLNALLSLLPPPPPPPPSSPADTARPTASFKSTDVYEDLNAVIVDAAAGTSFVGVRSIALAARAASLVLVHRMMNLVDGGGASGEGITDAEVYEHVTVRDAFISNAVALAQGALDMYPHSRILPKAVIGAVANLVVFYQHPRASATAKATTDDDDEGEDNESERADAELVAQLNLCPDEDVVRSVWDTCNHLLDLPEDGFAHDSFQADETVCGDEEAGAV